jgi:hypothetical protein
MLEWSELCFEAINQPLSRLLLQLYGSGITLVRMVRTALVMLLDLIDC